MLQKFSSLRSKASSNKGFSQRDQSPYGKFNSGYEKHQIPPASANQPNLLPGGQPSQEGIVAASSAWIDESEDIDSHVSFAESLFPVTVNERPTKRSSASDHRDQDSLINSESKSNPVPYTEKEKGKESKKNWDTSSQHSSGTPDVENPKSWDSDLEDRRKWDARSTKSWASQVSANSEKSFDAISRKSWVTEPGGKSRSLTSSSVPEEEINIGPAVLLPYEDAEEEFLEEFEDYFENLAVDNIRREQYPRLELQRLVYLDYATFALFSQFQVEEHMRILLEEGPCLGSVSLSRSSTSDLSAHVSNAQERVLRMLNTSSAEYSVIFTSGITASYRLVAQSYPFPRGCPLLVCQDNHEAVCHVVAAAAKNGGRSILAQVGENDLCFHGSELRQLLKRQGRQINNGGLFIYPAQSCLSGIRHSLNWIAEAQQNGWHVLVDVSTHLPTGSLDLMIYQPEFVIGSFNHIVGYPSGMGFFLVRRGAFCVETSTNTNTVKLIPHLPPTHGRDCHVVCEDDSLNLLSFAALSLGLEHLEAVGFSPIRNRMRALAAWLIQRLKSLRHKDELESPLVKIYGSLSTNNRGSIISFNVLDSTGHFFPATMVQKLAEKCNIVVTAGNFGNPGLANLLGMPSERVMDVSVFDQPGSFMAVRVSLGPVSNFQDVYRLVQFLSRFRDEHYLSTEAMGFIEEGN